MEYFTGAMILGSCILSEYPQSQLKFPFPRNRGENCECGNVQKGPKIVGGHNVTNHDFAWQVALLRTEDRSMGVRKSFFCAGSIITSKYILSAAHCAADRCAIIDSGSHVSYMFRPNSTIALLGVQDLSDPIASFSKELQVVNVAIHHQYDPHTLVNDIALFLLCKRVDFANWPSIRPACIPPPDLNLREKNITAIGWGSTSDNSQFTPILQEVSIPVVDDTKCKNYYKNVSINIEDTMICAGEAGKDSCQGDSGGPVHYKCAEGHYVLGGIVSFGFGCAQEEFPGIYTKVSKYADWIKKRTGYEACHVNCSTN